MEPTHGKSIPESWEGEIVINVPLQDTNQSEATPSSLKPNTSHIVPTDNNRQQQNLERSEARSSSESNTEWLPSRHLLTDRNPEKEELRLFLLKAALEGNIDAVKSQLNNPLFSDSSSSPLSAASSPSPFNVAITEKYETIFHVAAGANQTDFVEKMIDEIPPDDLKLQNAKGNTAFCFAVMAGNKSIAEKMLNNDPDLLTIRGGRSLTPLNLAAMFGEREMASYLYREYYRGTLTLADKKQLFFDSIDTTLYDLARELLEGDDNENELAMTEYEHGDDLLTPLHRLALTPFHLLDQKSKCYKTTLLNQALALVECLWEKIFKAKRDQVWDYLNEHRDLLFKAAQLGNFKILGKLIELYPDLVHLKDDYERTIFHIAIIHRHDDLFKLIDQIGFNKHLVASYADINENSLLHLAAKYPDRKPLSKENSLLHLATKYPDPRPLSMVPGAALEMQRELRIFKDVEKLVMPSFRELKNSEGKTPRELFTSTHAGLLKDGEKWMRSIASQCMLVAAIIALMVFQAAFPVRGGNNDNEGRNIEFRIFAMAEVIALSSSLISILMFLSIITSRYVENDFLISLPLKLVVGLLTLFISIGTMMLAFISSFYTAYDHPRTNAILILGIIFVSLPLFAFDSSQYSLLRDILYSFRFRFFC
ncbi:uncharacterized protein LOC116138857 [Pistacia vera]|uniref:uncharacterized protein LOC116138857 n=1 Tax=Pistacia vera TaxID=55513 RepID=UPI00126379DF|nr:uncharacterized protein LOC116138857 [Pistacia vera]